MTHIIKKSEAVEELTEISKLAKEIWVEYYTPLIGQAQTEYMISTFQSADRIQKDIEEKGFSYFTAFAGNDIDNSNSIGIARDSDNISKTTKPVGYFALQPDEKGVFISKIYISKEYRRRGIAGEIIQFSVCFAQEAIQSAETKYDSSRYETPRLWLTVNKGNSGSIEFYKKSGFEIIEEAVTDIGNGFVMDDYIMAFFFEK